MKLRAFFCATVFVVTALAQSGDQCDALANENSLLRSRVVALEHELQQSHHNSTCPPPSQDLDDASLLELFATSIKEKVFAVVPPTDDACTFDFVRGRCMPACLCSFKPYWGDYTPGRACRLVTGPDIDTNVNACADGVAAVDDRPWALRLAHAAHHHAKRAAAHALAKLREKSPPTDAGCIFSFKSFKCTPENECTWDFQLGDFNPHRACRYRGGGGANDDFVGSDSDVEDDDGDG